MLKRLLEGELGVRLLSVLQGSKSTSEAAIFNKMVLFVYTKAGSLNVDNVWVSKN